MSSCFIVEVGFTALIGVVFGVELIREQKFTK